MANGIGMLPDQGSRSGEPVGIDTDHPDPINNDGNQINELRANVLRTLTKLPNYQVMLRAIFSAHASVHL